MTPGRILLVDDEPDILEAMKRNLGNEFDIFTADSAKAGLEILKENNPFAVVISDMRMAEIDGIQFLQKVMKLYPHTVRIMLTGYVDLDNAVTAVNEGHVFRFITKPCTNENMRSVIRSGLEQHQLLRAEKDLLKKTLQGGIQMLTDLLAIANPMAFSRTVRIGHYVSQFSSMLNISNTWQYEVAAMLSQVGCVTIPLDILEKHFAQQELSSDEEQIIKEHPSVAHKLINHIPRLESVAEIIRLQQISHEELQSAPYININPEVRLGAEMLHLAFDLDLLLFRDIPAKKAIHSLSRLKKIYNPELLNLLPRLKVHTPTSTVRAVQPENLINGMILSKDVRTREGLLLALRGQMVNDTFRRCITNFAVRRQIDMTLRVSVASSNPIDPTKTDDDT